MAWKLFSLVSIATLLIATAASPQGSAPQVTMTTLSMNDQFGNPHELENLRGDVAVLVFADKQGAEASRALGARLHIAFHPSAQGMPPVEGSRAPVRPIPGWPEGARVPDVKMIAVACIGEVPTFIQGYVRSRFRSAAPDLPIWLDMTDCMRKQFGVSPGVPNVIVFDVTGRERYRVAGNLSDAQYGELTEAIEKVRGEAKPQ
jgi:hypothetical protein